MSTGGGGARAEYLQVAQTGLDWTFSLAFFLFAGFWGLVWVFVLGLGLRVGFLVTTLRVMTLRLDGFTTLRLNDFTTLRFYYSIALRLYDFGTGTGR